MKAHVYLLMSMLLFASLSLHAEDTVTVTATDGDISQNLDLKAVATLFGEVESLEDFETKLNDPEKHISNLDLNGDGKVDYLRVVEVGEGNERLVVLQAILAKDIYQDVASIYVERSEDNSVSVQVIGDEYIYGTNYIIEPVYVYRPVMFDWFWGPAYYAWHSPYYWGFYPTWWYAYDCWLWNDYWHFMYGYHHSHPYCSYRYRPEPRPHYDEMHRRVSRNDYANDNPQKSFANRNVSRSGINNARDINRQAMREQQGRAQKTDNVSHSSAAVRSQDNTFKSSNIRQNVSRSVANKDGSLSKEGVSRSSDNKSVQGSQRSSSQSSARSNNSSSTVRGNNNVVHGSSSSSSVRSGNSSSVRSGNNASRSGSQQRSSGSVSSGGSRSSAGSYSSSGGSRSSAGSYSSSGGSRSSAGSYSGGGGSRSSAGSYSSGGGSRSSSAGGGSRSGGGGRR